MKACSDALRIALFNNVPMLEAELYTFTLTDGTVLRWSSFDRPISYGGNTYQCTGFDPANQKPMFSRTMLNMGVGLDPTKLDVTIYDSGGSLVNGVPVLVAIAKGKFDNAWCEVRRVFMLPGDIPTQYNVPCTTNLNGSGDGTLVWFAGYVGNISKQTPISADFELRGLFWLLNRPTPKNTYMPQCWHTLYDEGCTLSPGAFAVSGACSAGSTTTVVKTGQANDANIPNAPVAGPVLTLASTNYSLAAATYFAVITWVTSQGETVASPQTSIAATPDKILTVHSPTSMPPGVSTYNVYVGTESGNEQKQNGIPIPLGTNWTMLVQGIYLTGILPPAFPTNGHWSLGRIVFTSGSNAGQDASIRASAPDGSVTLEEPLPFAPATGDLYTMYPGCDKIYTTCRNKFNNIVHFSGFPFIPTPEAGTGGPNTSSTATAS